MGLIHKDTFVCLDCETTGLDAANDRIIEIAVVIFTFDEVKTVYETLIDPEIPIPEASTEIHNITDAMVKNKPKIEEVLPEVFKLVGRHIIVGHAITTDINFLTHAAQRH